MLWTTPAHAAQEVYTTIDTQAAIERASPLARCIVEKEVRSLEPSAVGAQGELGVAQLHPRGKLPAFYALGFEDPFSPYQSLAYLEGALRRGEGGAWSVYPLCRHLERW